MADEFKEVTTQSWGSRLGDSIKGVAVGLLLFVVSFVVLFWGEGRAVRDAKRIEEGAKNVISVKVDKVEPANEGKLIHITGPAATSEVLADPEFGISANAIKLARRVDMYQWVEDKKTTKKKNVGGSETTETTYSYTKAWLPGAVDSSQFKQSGHENPPPAFATHITPAKQVAVGGFQLTGELIGKIDNFQPRPATQGDLANVPEAFKARARLDAGAVYLPAFPYVAGITSQPDPLPKVGDLRVRFEVAPPGPVSIIGKQIGSTFEPYTSAEGGTTLLLSTGTLSAQAMFAAEAAKNRMLTWLTRIGGFLLMFIGLTMVAKPLSVTADVLPFLGDLLSLGAGVVAFVVALALSLLTIAIAWLVYRPLIGICLLAGAVVVILLAKKFLGKPKAGTA
ncbi:MAG: TMEM43 family protein [Phycisphaerae bacterium]|nr:TMEM43 family protein [Phycisphaerae bacterium]